MNDEIIIPQDDNILLKECHVETFKASKKGGQHVNSTNSAVRILHIPTNTISTCQDERSQYLNKLKCIKELRLRIEKNNYIPNKRVRTKPTKGSIERRLLSKKHKSEKKKNRKKLNLDNY